MIRRVDMEHFQNGGHPPQSTTIIEMLQIATNQNVVVLGMHLYECIAPLVANSAGSKNPQFAADISLCRFDHGARTLYYTHSHLANKIDEIFNNIIITSLLVKKKQNS